MPRPGLPLPSSWKPPTRKSYKIPSMASHHRHPMNTAACCKNTVEDARNLCSFGGVEPPSKSLRPIQICQGATNHETFQAFLRQG